MNVLFLLLKGSCKWNINIHTLSLPGLSFNFQLLNKADDTKQSVQSKREGKLRRGSEADYMKYHS